MDLDFIRQMLHEAHCDIDISNITLRTAIALADALDISMDVFIDKKEEERKMKRWFLIDNATKSHAQIFETALDAKDQAEAIQIARREWDHLTDSEKKRRDDFFVGYAEEDEDGDVDWDTMTDIYSFKKE
jgi:hypothetical protein